MKIVNENIDHGKPFDFGKASHTYAQYRDIYPPEFYEKITKRGLCLKAIPHRDCAADAKSDFLSDCTN